MREDNNMRIFMSDEVILRDVFCHLFIEKPVRFTLADILITKKPTFLALLKLHFIYFFELLLFLLLNFFSFFYC